jgi:folylpolyglutamate synthase/dihydropteroate synthase
MFVTVQPETKRALPETALRKHIARLNLPVRKGGSLREGLSIARKEARKDWMVLVTGSHYVVGEAIPVLESRT